MANWWSIGFGIFFLVVGIALIITVAVSRSNNPDKTWTAGMIALLVFGILILILGLILIGFGIWYRPEPVYVPFPTPLAYQPSPRYYGGSPAAVAGRQEYNEALAAEREAEAKSIITDPVTGKKMTFEELGFKCDEMSLGELEKLVGKYPLYQDACGAALGRKIAEARY